MSEKRKLGELIDTLGVELEMDDEDLVSSAVVLLKVITEDGSIQLGIASSEGLDWIAQLGLIEAARDVVRGAERAE